MNARLKVLAIGGSDSAGIAGIQRDNATINAFGLHACNVITANTAQNSEGVKSVNACPDHVFQQQLDATLDEHVAAIKIGLLASEAQIHILTDTLRQYKSKITTHEISIVLDPVLSASSGENFSLDNLVGAYQNLLSLVSVVTPNLEEAAVLSGKDIHSYDDLHGVSASILSHGVNAVLLKGGHAREKRLAQAAPENSQSRDYFLAGDTRFWLASAWQLTENTRATGCAFASSVACAMALGYSQEDAVVIGKMAINQGFRYSYAIADQAGPVCVQAFPDEPSDLPQIQYARNDWTPPSAFPFPTLPDGKDEALGLYPVVDTAEWVERLLGLGVTTIQLRNKSLRDDALSQEIKRAVAIAESFNARLFINDYWQLAIEHGAYGVHLGQEDLHTANIKQIYDAGLRLGISTHCHYEVARAHTYRPSYMACGPVFPTTSKDMPWVPHGVEGLQYWRKVLEYPLVAIGGINKSRFADILKTGVESIAMISAITQASDPDTVTRNFIEMIND